MSTAQRKINQYILLSILLQIAPLTIILAQENHVSKDNNVSSVWKAGAASVVITPKEDMWMSGYAARDKPSDGKLHDLWVKALALEDQQGNRAVFITSDLIGFSRDLSHTICSQIQEKHKLDRSAVVLSSSHTHSGPVVNSNLHLIYPEFDQEQRSMIASYRSFLQKAVIACVDKAFNDMEIVTISSGIGIARFAVNRRNNLPEEVLSSNELRGPYDHSVPVLCVRSVDGTEKSILFGYACHCTTLDLYKWNGDYAGFAQMELEKKYAGSTAMFFAACAGDQNPEPRRLVTQAEQYGSELAAAAKAVLSGPMKNIKPELLTKYNEIELIFDDPLSVSELDSVLAKEPDWQKRWARHYKNKILNGEELAKSYINYPVQTWKLGALTMLSLGGEVVVDYAIRIKEIWGREVFIAAYSNDVMAYIPSERVLAEGRYEGNTSMRAYGQPAIWAIGIENKIIAEVSRQFSILGMKMQH